MVLLLVVVVVGGCRLESSCRTTNVSGHPSPSPLCEGRECCRALFAPFTLGRARTRCTERREYAQYYDLRRGTRTGYSVCLVLVILDLL